MFYALRRSFLSSPPDSPLTQQQRLPTTWTWPEERALQKTLCRRLVCGLWAATSVTFRKLQPCKLRNFFATYCCSCVWFSRDPRRFFGLIYCRFVSLAATLMPSLHQAVAYRFHIAKSALVPTLKLWNSGALELWSSGSLGPDPFLRSGFCGPRVRDRVLLASSLLSALASLAW